MGTLSEEAEALGLELDTRWSPQKKRMKIDEELEKQAKEELRSTKPKGKTVKVRLLKHYKPEGWYKVVGHYDAAEEIQEGAAPPPLPGVFYDHKLWVNTVVELPEKEARKLVEHQDTFMMTERDPNTRMVLRKEPAKKRRPLAEIVIDWSAKTNAA